MTFRPTLPLSDFAHSLEILLRLHSKAMGALARERHPDRRDALARDLAQRLEAELLRSGWAMTRAERPNSGANVGHGGVKG